MRTHALPLAITLTLLTLLAGHAVAQPCVPWGTGQAAFFVDASYNGKCVLLAKGDYPTPGAIGLPNDSISSIGLGAGTQVYACRDNYYQGPCQLITASTANLAGSKVGKDAISSLKVQPAGMSISCPPSQNEVAFFIDANFSGGCVLRGLGEYLTPESIGLPNDSISSFKLGTTAQVILCRDNNYGGDCELFTSDVGNLGSKRIGNDTVSSAKVEPRGTQDCKPGANQVAFFMHDDYVGPCSVRGFGDYDTPQDLGVPNDSTSSVMVGSGAQVVLYVDNNYGGNGEKFTASDSHLGDNTIRNDRVSSAHVQPLGTVDCPSGPNQVAVFMHSHFLAPCSVKALGDYPNAAAIGLNNDSISSIRVGSSVQACIYKDVGFSGESHTFTTDVADLKKHKSDDLNVDLNDWISSLRVTARGVACQTAGAGGGSPAPKIDLLIVQLDQTPFENPNTAAVCVLVGNSASSTAKSPNNQLSAVLTSYPAEMGYPLTVYATVPQIDPGTTASVCTQKVTLSAGHCYKLHICVDATNSVQETNETNNCFDWNRGYPAGPGGTAPPCQ